MCAEWSHGYTQTGDDLVYERQSGSMNEGFSDVFGESIDILNEDTADTAVLRSSSPATCTSTMNARYGQCHCHSHCLCLCHRLSIIISSSIFLLYLFSISHI